jgi:hypothetical protein
MKQIKFALLALIAGLTVSCSSSSSSGSASDATFINFKVNGTQSNMVDVTTITSLMGSITGSEDVGQDTRTVIFTIPTNPTVGTHQITDASGSDLTAYSATYYFGNTSVTATSGTYTITAIGAEYMEGTFSFTGDDAGENYAITEGTFRVYKPTPTN